MCFCIFFLVFLRGGGCVGARLTGREPWPWAMQVGTLWPSAAETNMLLLSKKTLPRAPAQQSAAVRTQSQLLLVLTTLQLKEVKTPRVWPKPKYWCRSHKLSREPTDHVKTAAYSNRTALQGGSRHHPLPSLLQTPKEGSAITIPPQHVQLLSSPSPANTATSTPPCAAPAASRIAQFSKAWARVQAPATVLVPGPTREPLRAAACLPAPTVICILITHRHSSLCITTSAGRSTSRAKHKHQVSGRFSSSVLIPGF